MTQSNAESAGSAYTVRSLDQVKLLADPLRLRLLRAFVGGPKTTKQVADLLGENAPRLYRHVEALRQAGLLRLVKERRKRGTVERYLEAIASRFEVDRSLFDPSGPSEGEFGEPAGVLRSLFRTTESELLDLARHTPIGSNEGLQPVAARFTGYATKEQLHDLRARLLDWLRSCEASRGTGGGAQLEFGGMVTLYVMGAFSGGPAGESGLEDSHSDQTQIDT